MSEEILTTPANVTSYLAKGFRVTEVHITGEFGEQLVRMEREDTDTEPMPAVEKGTD